MKWSSIWSNHCADGTCEDDTNGGVGNGDLEAEANDTSDTITSFSVNILDDMLILTIVYILNDIRSLIQETGIKQRKYSQLQLS